MHFKWRYYRPGSHRESSEQSASKYAANTQTAQRFEQPDHEVANTCYQLSGQNQ
jgi:hypothetical protein